LYLINLNTNSKRQDFIIFLEKKTEKPADNSINQLLIPIAMKKIFTIIFLALCGICNQSNAQGVAISTENSNPDPSAMLDVKSNNKGLLAPRMTQAQRNAIINPATGLLIFQTDGSTGLYYNAGVPAIPTWTMLGSTASQWQNNGSNIYYNLGRVGIGTTNPDASLSVANTSLGGTATPGSFQIGQSNTYNLVCDNNEVQARFNSGSSTLFLQYWGGDISACNSGGAANFYGPVGISNNLNVSGRIGIKTAPSYDLQITSTDYTAAYISSSYNGGTTAEVIATGTAGGTWGLYSFATTLGYAGYFSGNIYCSGSYLPSDEKLKENIQPMQGALSKVMKLDVKTYNYKTTEFPEMNLPANIQNGFTAQNLENVFPELVKVNPAKKEQPVTFKAVNYIGLIPVLTEAIQEQQKQLEAKDASIDILQNQFNDLQNKFNDLKTMVMNVQKNH
jgi:hypothetical protein